MGIVLLGLVPVAPAAGGAAAGKGIYTALCVRCHGKTGRGDGPDGTLLATKPRNFTDCARMQALSDQESVTVITEGGAARHLSKDMPPWGTALHEQQIADLVAYLRSFCAQ